MKGEGVGFFGKAAVGVLYVKLIAVELFRRRDGFGEESAVALHRRDCRVPAVEISDKAHASCIRCIYPENVPVLRGMCAEISVCVIGTASEKQFFGFFQVHLRSPLLHGIILLELYHVYGKMSNVHNAIPVLFYQKTAFVRTKRTG